MVTSGHSWSFETALLGNTALWRKSIGAGDENRNRVLSLGSSVAANWLGYITTD